VSALLNNFGIDVVSKIGDHIVAAPSLKFKQDVEELLLNVTLL